MEGFDHDLQPRMTPAGDARGAKALSISIAFTSLAIFFVLCRFYARVFVVKRIGADDWMSLVSLVCCSNSQIVRNSIVLTIPFSFSPLYSWVYLLVVSIIKRAAQSSCSTNLGLQNGV